MECGHLDFTTTNVGSRYVLGTTIAEPNLMRSAQAEIGVAAPDFHAGTGTLRITSRPTPPCTRSDSWPRRSGARRQSGPWCVQRVADRSASATAGRSKGDIAAGLGLVAVGGHRERRARSALRISSRSSRLGSSTPRRAPRSVRPWLNSVRPPSGRCSDHCLRRRSILTETHVEVVPGTCTLPDIITNTLSVVGP